MEFITCNFILLELWNRITRYMLRLNKHSSIKFLCVNPYIFLHVYFLHSVYKTHNGMFFSLMIVLSTRCFQLECCHDDALVMMIFSLCAFQRFVLHVLTANWKYDDLDSQHKFLSHVDVVQILQTLQEGTILEYCYFIFMKKLPNMLFLWM